MLPSRVNRLVLLSMAGVLLAQAPIDNEGVMKLVKSGMTEDMVISVIQKQPGSYVLGADDFVTLKAAGVSEKILAAYFLPKWREQPGQGHSQFSVAPKDPSYGEDRGAELEIEHASTWGQSLILDLDVEYFWRSRNVRVIDMPQRLHALFLRQVQRGQEALHGHETLPPARC